MRVLLMVHPELVGRLSNGTLTGIDLPAPSDDDVAQLARTVCLQMTAVERWQKARGEAEPPEHADELASLMVADLGAAAPRIDEELTQKRPGRPGRLAAMCDGLFARVPTQRGSA